MQTTQAFPKAHELPLANAPLVRVLAQVRFEQILTIQNQASLAPFQDAIRETYPLFRAERSRTVVKSPEGSLTIEQPPIWKFCDLAEEWKISLAPDFLAIDTTVYRSRDEFLARFEMVLEAFSRHLKPGVISRVGIRYIDRITDEALSMIPSLVRPQFVGVLNGIPNVKPEATASEALFKLGDNHLFARWGLLPPEATVDPAALEPINKVSWILDIDSSNSKRQPWNQSVLQTSLQELACISYDFFRWAVTDDFLDYYGAKT